MVSRMALVLVGIFGGGVTAGIVASPSGEGDRSSDSAPPGPAVPAAVPAPPGNEPPRLDPELATALYRVGLQPENLTASGVASGVTDDVVVGVKTWLGQNTRALGDADQAYFDAITKRDQLVRLVQSGLASPEQIAECQVAKTDFDTKDAARKALLDTVFNAGTAPLLSGQKTQLARLRVNQSAWNVPLEYLVLDRTQEDWVHVRQALANERISARYGEDPDPDDQAYLATVRADPTVSTAKVNLDTNLGAVKAAWEQAAAE